VVGLENEGEMVVDEEEFRYMKELQGVKRQYRSLCQNLQIIKVMPAMQTFFFTILD
jgi:hypothetical protein